MLPRYKLIWNISKLVPLIPTDAAPAATAAKAYSICTSFPEGLLNIRISDYYLNYLGIS